MSRDEDDCDSTLLKALAQLRSITRRHRRSSPAPHFAVLSIHHLEKRRVADSAMQLKYSGRTFGALRLRHVPVPRDVPHLRPVRPSTVRDGEKER